MRLFIGAFCAALSTAVIASAQSCGGTYKIKGGDTLSGIADFQYNDARKWSAIFNANREQIGDSPNKIRVGQRLNLPCINGLPTGLEGGVSTAAPKPAPVSVETKQVKVAQMQSPRALRVNLLTADDYAPFTDRNSLNGGLVTEIAHSAMTQASGTDGYQVHWVNDWSAHLDPLLSNAMLDMGFPWLQPDCAQNPDNYRCANFEFSDPMFEMLVLLFIDRTHPIQFREDNDIFGMRICRPKGYYTHDLDKDGRNWLRDGKITLVQPVSVADCFEALIKNEADAVALNEFTGRKAIKDLELGARVDVVQSRPLSIEGLHVLVHKSHPDAAALVETVNRGLDQIKQNGTYQDIIDRHMSKIWSEL